MAKELRPHDELICGLDYDCSCDECRPKMYPEIHATMSTAPGPTLEEMLAQDERIEEELAAQAEASPEEWEDDFNWEE